MTIRKLQFTDSFREWKLNTATFSDFNLLVGKSGVGKTSILSAFRALRRAGTQDVRNLNGCSWKVELQIKDKVYTWTACMSRIERDDNLTAVLPGSADTEDSSGRSRMVVSEEIREEGQAEPLVSRTQDRFTFQGNILPRLKNDISAIALLREEEAIAPLHTALKRILFSEAPQTPEHRELRFFVDDPTRLNTYRKRCNSLQMLREATDIPIIYRAWILQDAYPDEFSQIQSNYFAIFPTVTELKVGKSREFDSRDDSPFNIITIAAKEEGVAGWVVSARLSSGMYRTLIHLFELALAPAGTVIIIDELENSLGVNCLDEIVSNLLQRSRDLQFVVTSHHPYVIANVPINRWRIVTRKGSVITVKDENSIPALQGKSAHDNFIRLINLAEYEEGIQ